VPSRSLQKIRRATGLYSRYATLIRNGIPPHPIHFRALAARHAFDRAISAETRAALIAWYAAEVAPKVVLLSVAEICRVTGLAPRSAHIIRKGMAPHPRHFTTLAQLVGVRWAAVDGAEGGRDAVATLGVEPPDALPRFAV
jgi:hypothetical protein